MRCDRRFIQPLLKEKQPRRVFAIDMDVVGNTTRFAAGTDAVLGTQPDNVIMRFGCGRDGAGNDYHAAGLTRGSRWRKEDWVSWIWRTDSESPNDGFIQGADISFARF